MEYTTQDSDPNLFKPLKKPIAERAAALRKQLVDTEPKHLDALLELADRAYRRPLAISKRSELRALYDRLRKQGLDHDAAFRLTLARVLIAPAFLYRAEQSAAGRRVRGPSRTGSSPAGSAIFLWSSMPDAELRRLAAEGTLHEPEVLAAQVRRMLADSRARALATEFACQWLDIRGFDQHNEKSEQVFPEFAALRGAMYEEAVRFFVDLFQRDGSLLEVIDTDHTFLNEALARHYGISGVTGPRVAASGRGQGAGPRRCPGDGGLARQAVGGLADQPHPPRQLAARDAPGREAAQAAQERPPVARERAGHGRTDHAADHREAPQRSSRAPSATSGSTPSASRWRGFDAIGRRRKTDLGGRPIDTQVELKDGTTFADIAGLREYSAHATA